VQTYVDSCATSAQFRRSFVTPSVKPPSSEAGRWSGEEAEREGEKSQSQIETSVGTVPY